MNIEQERAAFEAWYQHHHGDLDVYVLDEFGEYADKQVQGAFNVWQARAALQSQDMEDAAYAEWMVDDARAPWAVNSLKTLIKEMRATEKQCRNAFRKDYMRVVSEYFADALGEAAEVLEKRLSAIDHARRIEGDGE